jgi:toxin ParE1/3/4
MKVRWTRPAIEDLASIFRHIRKDDSAAARRVRMTVATVVAKLSSMEDRGRKGEVPGTRELIFHPWPYIAVYEIVSDEVRILRIRHASQQWP